MAVNLNTELGKLKLNSPIIMASGTFGYGAEKFQFIDYKKIGAITTKTITYEKWEGNPQPRISEIPSGMINNIGLQNPGIKYFCEKIYPSLEKLKKEEVKIFVSITDRTLDNIIKIVEKLNYLKIDAIELNFSCPNFEKNNLMISQIPDKTFSVVKETKKVSKFPVITKLSPNVTDIVEIAIAASEGGSDILCMVNTVKGIFFDWGRKKIIEGGISGQCIKGIGLRCVYDVYKRVKIPIIGLGGIVCGKDALEYILIGADAFGIGSGFFSNPGIVNDVFNYLSSYLTKKGIKNIKQIVGILNEKGK